MSPSPICAANSEPKLECVVSHDWIARWPVTGTVASRRTRSSALPCDPSRRTMKAAVCAVLIESIS